MIWGNFPKVFAFLWVTIHGSVWALTLEDKNEIEAHFLHQFAEKIDNSFKVGQCNIVTNLSYFDSQILIAPRGCQTDTITIPIVVSRLRLQIQGPGSKEFVLFLESNSMTCKTKNVSIPLCGGTIDQKRNLLGGKYSIVSRSSSYSVNHQVFKGPIEMQFHLSFRAERDFTWIQVKSGDKELVSCGTPGF